MEERKVPALRFKEFKDGWEKRKIKEILQRYSKPVAVEDKTLYQQIGVRSHGKGIFHKEFVDGKELGNKRVFWVKEIALVVNIVFAWEQAIAVTSEKEKGMIASHRFPMYLPLNEKADVNFLLKFFLTPKGKSLLELASPGGAGRNKTLGQQEFEKLSLVVPSLPEQQKIASFFTAIDQKLAQLRQKKVLLERYKKGVMQRLFSQALRFRDEGENEYPEWEKKKLSEVAKFRRGSFPQPYGLPEWYDDVNGAPFVQVYDVDENFKLKADTKNKISDAAKPMSVFVEKGTVVLTLQGTIGRIAITQYNCFVDRTLLIFERFTFPIDRYFFMYIVYLLFQIEKEKAPGGTIKTITKEVLSDFVINLPSLEEQTKIATFLSALDDKISQTATQIKTTERWKNGLLQKMFC